MNTTSRWKLSGFRKSIRAGVVLNVGGTVTENVSLEVGSVAESVVVEANVVRVQTADAQVARAITLRDIDVLPQLGRTPIGLAIFQPGVQIDGSNETYSRVNGLRQGSNNTTLDGIDVNDHAVPRLGLAMTANNTDSVEEFRVVTNGGKAEYGRNAGAQVELITRSGTNKYHGNAFDYLRNTDLNASTFFNNKAGIARPAFIQNIFGGSFGGPIRKDSTFIFGNYQGRRTRQQTSRNRTVPTPEAKAGLFRWNTSAGIQSYDIVKNDPRGKGIDPAVAAILKLYPDPNDTTIGDGLNSAGFRFNNPTGSMEDQYTIKGDQNFRGGHHVFMRWSWQRNSSIDWINNYDATFPGQAQGTQGGTRWGYSIGYDWVINGTLVNEFRTGYQKAVTDFLRPARLKGPMIIMNEWTDPLSPTFAQGRYSPVREFTDNLTKIQGKHTFKAGLNWRFTQAWGFNDAGIYPNITTARLNGNVPAASIGPAGLISTDRQRFEYLYNNLLGRMDQVTVTYYSDLEKFQPVGSTRLRDNRFNEYGYFFQDDWKVNPSLTLNLGLRYEFNGVPYEVNKLQGTLDKAAQISAVSQIGDFKIQRSTKWYNNDWNNFAPRLGFAWDVTGTGRTALRGSWGIFYDRIIGATTSYVDGNTPGFAQQMNVYPNQGGTDVRISDGAIPVPPMPGAPLLSPPMDRNVSIVVFDPNLRTGYVQHISLTLQQEIYRNTVVEAGYIGTRGIKLFQDVNWNQARIYGDFLPAFQELQAYRSKGTPVSANNPIVKLFGTVSNAISRIGASTIDLGAVGTASQTVDRTNYKLYDTTGTSNFWLRNFPQFNQVVVGRNDGRSSYNSFVLSLRRQAGALKFNANYTFSKSIDNGSVDGNGFTSPIDSFNLSLNRGRGDYDRPHSFNSSFIYTLPIGKGRRFAGDAPRWVDTLIGGWDLGVLNIWQSGSVMSISAGRVTGPYYNVNSWANYNGDRNIGSIQRMGDGVMYFAPEQMSAFQFPSAGETGTSGRNAFRGPRFFNIDMSLVKKFRFTESHGISFRAEAYNLLNNPNFSNPAINLVNYIPTDLSKNTFGRISSTVNPARIFQMALRYEF